MPLRASAVGERFGSRTVEVTPRMMLAYAAAIGQTGRRTFDDADAGSFVAAPQFCVVLEWPVISDPGMRNLLGITQEEMRRTLHVGQDSHFYRPIVAGQRLTVHGTVVDIRETHAGAITSSKLETVDAETKAPVVTSWTTALMRDVTVEGRTEPASKKPAAYTGSHAPGQSLEIPVARELPHIYSECAAIWNPIHTERRIALSAGLPDIILHGTATWALAGREIIRVYADNEPQRLRRLAGRFGAVVIPGTTITLEHQPAAGEFGNVYFVVRNAQGDEAISEGIAELAAA